MAPDLCPRTGASHLQLTHLAWRHARAVLLSLTALLLSLSAYSLLLDSPFTPLSARITNAQFVPPTLIQPAGDGSLSFFGVLGTGIGAMSAALTAQARWFRCEAITATKNGEFSIFTYCSTCTRNFRESNISDASSMFVETVQNVVLTPNVTPNSPLI